MTEHTPRPLLSTREDACRTCLRAPHPPTHPPRMFSLSWLVLRFDPTAPIRSVSCKAQRSERLRGRAQHTGGGEPVTAARRKHSRVSG